MAIKVNKKHGLLKRLSKQEDSFAKASPQELLSFMWELTAELWSLKGSEYAERRLQRNAAKLIEQ